MPELSQKERLQLSLLDRLTDDEPHKKSESRDKRVISVSRLKELVQRDLAWLLNTVASSTNTDFDDYPQIQSSTLNYGIPDLSGSNIKSLNTKRLEREIVKSIKRYEARIIPHTLSVKVKVANEEMSSHTLSFEISADLWAQPLPLQLYLQTDVDIENGHVSIRQWH
ncbi:type VI secretion system baseplate subunit TssE [Ningiella sp. W23]|uniref:type VI secretion system baseplate subunit TssE n=1 Tax=Ningiella sp. W23 TaxID=3023715 RepID=UPI003757B556